MANIPQEPRRQDYSTERAYAEAWAAWRNLQEAQRIASLNFSNDDGQNQGTVRTAADSAYSTTVTTTRQTGQKPGQLINRTDTIPGITKSNVLSKLSSYTYSITLYMCTVEAIKQFIESGGSFPTNRNDIFVVAQSAGVNNVAERRLITKSRQLGPGQQGNDYYIDDLSMTTVMPSNKTTGATASFDLKFKIYEPLGFSFLSDLIEMSRKVNNLSSSTRSSPLNQFQQNFILGIKFYGYDVNGVPIKSTDPLFSNGLAGTTDVNSVSERYFSINFTNFNYSIDETSTEYSIEAIVSAEYAAAGQINGVTKSNISLVGKTVKDVLIGQSADSASTGSKSLVDILNSKNLDLRDKGYTDFITTYEIQFLNKDGQVDNNSPIATATITNNRDVERSITAMSDVKNTLDSTVRKSINAQTNDITRQNITIPAGCPIVHAIDNILVNSSYVGNALNLSTDQTAQTSSKSKPTNNEFEFYSIVCYAVPGKKDPKTNFPTYHIVYQIKPKEITRIRSENVVRTTPYKGPFKEYEYIFTGKNTEILKFEQNFNNQYFVIRAITDSPAKAKVNPNEGVPTYNSPRAEGDNTGIKNNGGSDVAIQVRTNLYSPQDQSEATIKILGDPDFIMTRVGVNNGVPGSNKYYGPDGSIDPFSSDVLIEIIFKSPEDYDINGLLNVDRQVQFYQTDEPLRQGIKGIVYSVMWVESSFSRGTFTQTLQLIIVPEEQLLGKISQTEFQRENNIVTSTPTQSDVRISQQLESDAFFSDAALQLTTDDEFFSDVAPRLTTDDEFFSDINDDRVLPVNRSIPEVTEERARILNDRTDENLGTGAVGGIVGA